jgi:hypothetical protein
MRASAYVSASARKPSTPEAAATSSAGAWSTIPFVIVLEVRARPRANTFATYPAATTAGATGSPPYFQSAAPTTAEPAKMSSCRWESTAIRSPAWAC